MSIRHLRSISRTGPAVFRVGSTHRLFLCHKCVDPRALSRGQDWLFTPCRGETHRAGHRGDTSPGKVLDEVDRAPTTPLCTRDALGLVARWRSGHLKRRLRQPALVYCRQVSASCSNFGKPR